MMILNPYVVFSRVSSIFEAVFDTTKTSTGSSDANSIRLPLTNMDGLVVNWGDGTINSSNTHTYSTSGVKTVKIEGAISGWRFNNTGDVLKLIEIKSWGNFIINLNSTFYGCANLNLNNSNGKPVIITTDMSNTFRTCSSITTVNNINNWDMSNVTSMDRFFAGCTLFNQDLNNLNVSNVTIFNGCFLQCTNFNGNITSWDTSRATLFSLMFLSATAFNQNIGGWDVSNVSSISSMFQNATAFNQNIGSWDVSNVSNAGNFMLGKTPGNLSSNILDQIYNGWSTRTLKTSLNISFGSAKYTSAGQAGRDILTTTYGWTITDGGI